MHSKLILALATLMLATAVQAAIVGAPANIERLFALALEPTTTAAHALAPRATDPLECDGYCWGEMHCCLIAGLYPRCHSKYTPCSKISFPNALSAPAPHPPVDTTTTAAFSASGNVSASSNSTTTITLTQAATTVIGSISAGLAAKQQLADPTTAALNVNVVTEITTQTIATTTFVPIVLSPIPPPTTLPPPPINSAATSDITSIIPAISALSFSSLPLSYAPDSSTSDVEPDSISPLSPGDVALSISTNTADPSTSSPSPSPSTTLTQQSTVTSVSVVASTTTTATSTEGLTGEPSAIASSLGSNGAVAVVMGRLGGGFGLLELVVGWGLLW